MHVKHFMCRDTPGCHAAQSLRKLHAELRHIGAVGAGGAPPLTWLFECGGAPTDAQLDAFAAYGQGIAPEKVCMLTVLSRVLSTPRHRNCSCQTR
jgi:hypothetical protein